MAACSKTWPIWARRVFRIGNRSITASKSERISWKSSTDLEDLVDEVDPSDFTSAVRCFDTVSATSPKKSPVVRALLSRACVRVDVCDFTLAIYDVSPGYIGRLAEGST